MRKHFLLLMLMALLPLAGWAAEYSLTLTPYVISKTYGQADPGAVGDFPEAKFAIVENTGTATKAQIAAQLSVVRLTTGETVGAYAYTFPESITIGDDTYTIVCTQNGSLNITKKAFTINATAANKDYDGTAAPTEDLACTVSDGVNTTWATILAASDLNEGAPKAGLFSIARESDGANANVYANDIVPVWNDNDNYDVTINSANYTINAKALTGVNFTQAAYSITYGETPSFAYTLQNAEESLVGSETLADNFGAKLITDADLPTDVTAATGIKVVCTSGNYTLTNASAAATFEILAKAADATGMTFTIADNLTYLGGGNDIAMTYGEGNIVDVTDGSTHLANPASYSVAYYTDEECTAAAAAIHDAGTYYAKFTMTGNYSGTKVVSFAVAAAPLTVTAEDKVKAFGDADPAYTVAYDGWLGTDDDALVTTEPTVTRADAEAEDGENVGEHALTVSGGEVTNYTLSYTAGTLTIGKQNIEIACDNLTKAWKGTDPTLTYTVTPAALKAQLTTLPILTRVEGEEIGNYAITAAGAVADADKYTITYNPGNFEITKAELTITAKDQTVAKDAAAIDTEVSESTIAVTGFVNGETIADLAAVGDEFTAALTIAKAGAADLAVAGEYADGIKLSALASVHYNINYNFGTLNVIGAGMDLTLTRDEYCASKIAEADGQNVNVKLSGRALTKKTWNSFVLPFDITVAQLSQAYGYAVVNRLNTTTSIGSEVHFSLEMETIPANEPFLMKTATDIAAGDVIELDGVNIVNPESAADLTVGTEGNTQFVGIYTKTAITESNWMFPNNSADGANWVGGATGVNLKPLAAYVIKPNASARIFIEDIDDNGTTVIKQIGVDGTMKAYNVDGWYTLGGVKLQGAPTEKGIYINNGKKVVIK